MRRRHIRLAETFGVLWREILGTWMYGLNNSISRWRNSTTVGRGRVPDWPAMSKPIGENIYVPVNVLSSGACRNCQYSAENSFKEGLTKEQLRDAGVCANMYCPCLREVYPSSHMGHLRYPTPLPAGKSGSPCVHPFLRRNNWRAKNLAPLRAAST